MARYYNESYLEHHGIKGQKWYVRRFQNEDGTLTDEGRKRYSKIMDKQSMKDKEYTKTSDLIAKTLPKGMNVRRITMADENFAGSRLTYVSYTKADQANIRAITPWLMSVRGKKVDDAVEKNYKLTKDIRIPSQNEVDDIMKSVVKDPKERKAVSAASTIDRWFAPGSSTSAYLKLANDKSGQQALIKQWMAQGFTEAESRDTLNYKIKYCKDLYNKKAKEGEQLLNKISKGETLETADWHYGKQVMTMALGKGNSTYQKKVVDELQKRGYDGMYDNAMISAGTSNGIEAYEPIIIFNPEKNLSDTGKSTKMNAGKVADAEYKYQKWRKPIIENRHRSDYYD